MRLNWVNLTNMVYSKEVFIIKEIVKVLTIIILFSFLIVECGESDMQGIVLDTSEGGLTLARELTPDEYEEIKDISPTKLHNEDVEGKRDLGLIILSYEDMGEINKGDEVDVWIGGGDIMESYPPQADAKKVSVRE